jgi:hypothetical protein
MMVELENGKTHILLFPFADMKNYEVIIADATDVQEPV